jgi:hypothetical protein
VKDYSKLLGRIIELYGTRDAFGKAINWNKSRISSRLNNLTPFKQDEIDLWCEYLNIPSIEIGVFFYSNSSQIVN